ncbi:FAD-dependent oxidoreductase [Amycolatopsis sp. H20-H5]|uniref:FAD-dependent oxidoreductase n=1 Tax=Amycolatopsis sp. H20-H5 TaxID=3046309 RepID=UPI002DBDB869|nr:FAD-dependent oxidoreductase [Amycolatopsis sp. H20-H5]MEC3975261.1 FAD-dependent oxidoreductase [Amycolatopsis sp. H20-H5]
MEAPDAVIIGSGHNALVTGACLARAGWEVLVLEANDRPGGLNGASGHIVARQLLGCHRDD